MDQNKSSTGILHSVGEEIIRIITPLSISMFSIVILVSVLGTDSSNASSISTIATIAYTDDSFDSEWDKFKGALLNSLVFVAVVTVVTFLLVLHFYFRCTSFLSYYMGFYAFLVLGFMGGEIGLFLIQVFRIAIDCFTYVVLLLNFTIVRVIGVLTAYCFTMLLEWTSWVLLVAMASYDLAATVIERKVWRERPVNPESQIESQVDSESIGSSQTVEEVRARELSAPLIEWGQGPWGRL